MTDQQIKHLLAAYGTFNKRTHGAREAHIYSKYV